MIINFLVIFQRVDLDTTVNAKKSLEPYSFHYFFKSRNAIHCIIVLRRTKVPNQHLYEPHEHCGICYNAYRVGFTSYLYKIDGIIKCQICDE